ncbi:methionine synthase [Oscillatoria sp. CS-180]|uniref:Npun_R2821/Npun_R2822 family protein n=1 Tax=Oscillatoria sp. CS-180 TaxID=3021720 RepID=UPI00232AAF78|nr:Npun_R2821/Npun_R2822 family protein [Oscillatoria sp. CS-180]MDB9525730.1 methionine synthase [Oscillatoria sp. CS-180]
MERGIYITANDKVMDHAIACVNSIRLYDPDTPIMMIPYNDHYQGIAQKLKQDHGVETYPDLAFIERLSQKLQAIFGSDFFARPNQFRKQACWFGPFEKFLYIDTDVVVFSKISRWLDALNDYDFLCYDYQHKGGITNVFSEKVVEDKIFTEIELQDIFNGGFWASKKELITEEDLYEVFRNCANHPDYFDFSQKTSDQPIINYMVLKRLPKRLNLVRADGKGPGNWAGMSHFEYSDMRLVDPKVQKDLDYLHWAGIRIEAGCPYWDIWLHYRYLNDSEGPPPEVLNPPQSKKGVKTWLRDLKQAIS